MCVFDFLFAVAKLELFCEERTHRVLPLPAVYSLFPPGPSEASMAAHTLEYPGTMDSKQRDKG